MANKFADLRSGMAPAAQARAAKAAETMLAEIAHIAGKSVREGRVTELAQPGVGEIREAAGARNVDEVVASLPAVRRAKVEKRARELASSSTKPSPSGKRKRTVRRRSRAASRDGGRRNQQ